MKKVLVIYHYYPHYRLPILEALTNQKKAAIEYTFLSGITADIPIKLIDKKDVSNTLKWITVKNIWFMHKILWQKEVVSKSISSEYDCIIYLGNPYFLSTWVGALLAKMTKKRVLFWTHGFIRSGSMIDQIKKVFFHLADGLLLYGNKAKDNLIQKGFKEKNLYVIYNSLDYDKQLLLRNKISPEDIKEERRKLFKYDENPILLFIGRLTKQKKLSDLLLAAKQLHKQGIHVNVLFIGEGEEKNDLIQTTEQNSLSEFVCFYGATHNETELAPLISLSDICVAPGEVGLTAMHSLVYGTPVITHNNYLFQMPEYEAIVEGKTGLLYEYGSNDSLIEKITQWIKDKKDREVIREDCYNIIDTYYNPDKQVDLINYAVMDKST